MNVFFHSVVMMCVDVPALLYACVLVPQIMNSRIKKLTKAFQQHKIDAFLVTKDINITYLTGFNACESWLFVGPRRTCYITDFRYMYEARAGLKGISVKRYRNSIYETLLDVAQSMKVKRIGIDTRHLTLSQYQSFQRKIPKGIRLVKADNLVEDLRIVKDKAEIKKVKKALEVHKQAHVFIKKNIKPNITERELLLKLERFVKTKGADFSFDPIIASGANSSYPHAKVTNRKIRCNQPLLIDMGIDVEGYKSDLTRMFFLGKISALVRQVYDAVFEAQKCAISGIRDGISVSKIDDLARNCLKKKGLEKYFGHALGHGVGLEIHESPRLAHNDSSILKEGMIITVEPAVYLPGEFGIRIEDMVLVRKNDCEILSDDIH